MRRAPKTHSIASTALIPLLALHSKCTSLSTRFLLFVSAGCMIFFSAVVFLLDVHQLILSLPLLELDSKSTLLVLCSVYIGQDNKIKFIGRLIFFKNFLFFLGSVCLL